jgi:hypothetical protein
MNSQKILTIIAGVVGVISIFLLIRIIGAGDDAIKAGEDGSVAPLMYVAYVIFAISLALVVVFTLKNIATNPGALKSALTSVGAFALVGLICYFVLASGVETPMRDDKVLSASGSQLVGAGLYMFYALAFIAVGAMLFTGVKKMIK